MQGYRHIHSVWNFRVKLAVTFYDDWAEPLRFTWADIRSILVGGVVAHVKMLQAYTGESRQPDEALYSACESDIEQTPIFRAYKVIYDYANDAILPPDGAPLEEHLRIAIAFRLELVYANELYGMDIGQATGTPESPRYAIAVHTGRALETLLCGFLARWKLDVPGTTEDDDAVRIWAHMFAAAHPELLSLSEIAVLADIQERSVRNYTHSTRDGLERLRTLKVGGRTYVTPHDAKEWLSRRRRFIPTRRTPASDNH